MRSYANCQICNRICGSSGLVFSWLHTTSTCVPIWFESSIRIFFVKICFKLLNNATCSPYRNIFAIFAICTQLGNYLRLICSNTPNRRENNCVRPEIFHVFRTMSIATKEIHFNWLSNESNYNWSPVRNQSNEKDIIIYGWQLIAIETRPHSYAHKHLYTRFWPRIKTQSNHCGTFPIENDNWTNAIFYLLCGLPELICCASCKLRSLSENRTRWRNRSI